MITVWGANLKSRTATNARTTGLQELETAVQLLENRLDTRLSEKEATKSVAPLAAAEPVATTEPAQHQRVDFWVPELAMPVSPAVAKERKFLGGMKSLLAKCRAINLAALPPS